MHLQKRVFRRGTCRKYRQPIPFHNLHAKTYKLKYCPSNKYQSVLQNHTPNQTSTFLLVNTTKYLWNYCVLPFGQYCDTLWVSLLRNCEILVHQCISSDGFGIV